MGMKYGVTALLGKMMKALDTAFNRRCPRSDSDAGVVWCLDNKSAGISRPVT